MYTDRHMIMPLTVFTDIQNVHRQIMPLTVFTDIQKCTDKHMIMSFCSKIIGSA